MNLLFLGGIVCLINSKASPLASLRPKKITKMVTNEFLIARTGATINPITSPLNFDWSMIESEDYPTYIANLRAIGCPEKTVRDIILADIEKSYGARRGGILYPPDDTFWRTRSQREPAKLERENQLRGLYQEKKELLKELLGIDLELVEPPFDGSVTPQELIASFLPAEKQKQFKAIFESFVARMSEMRGRPGGILTAEDTEQLNQLSHQMESELARLLTPDEQEEFWLRVSATELGVVGFSGTERQYRTLAKLQKDFNFAHRDLLESNDNSAGESVDHDKGQLDDRIRAFLGERGYADYQRSTDGEFHELFFFAEENNVPLQSAIKAYDLKKATDSEVGRIRADDTLSVEERNAALKEIRRQTERAFSRALGPAAYQAYLKSAGGWIQNLNQP